MKKEDTPEVPLLISKTQEGKYSFADVETNSTLTITIGTARRNPTAEAQVTAGQVFSPIIGTSATISKDSAYTAAFQIKNFSPSYEDDSGIQQLYSDLKLTFATALPKDTTIILLDRQDKTYWHYRATADDVASEVSLTAFQKMGGNGSEPYHIPTSPENKIYVDLNYQFIVDFSQCAKHFDDGTTLAMTLDTVTDDSIEDWNPPHLNEGSGFCGNSRVYPRSPNGQWSDQHL